MKHRTFVRDLFGFVVMALALGWGLAAPAVAAETVTYYYTNPQGTVLATADAAGNLLTTTDYRPYGAQVLGNPAPGPGYTGHVGDPDSGLVYMQARYYDPSLGRFLSIDPVGPSPSDIFDINRYVYVHDSPVQNTDPTGRQCAQCLYYPGNLDRQARINQAASKMALGPSFGAVPIVGAVQGVAAAIADPTALNIGAAIVGAIPEVGGAAASSLRGASAAARAAKIAGAMTERTQRAVTIAVTETAEGTRVVSSSEGVLRPAARAALVDGETAVKGAVGTHAEINGINGARDLGLTPTGTAASRPICSNCAKSLEQEGVEPLSPLKDPQN